MALSSNTVIINLFIYLFIPLLLMLFNFNIVVIDGSERKWKELSKNEKRVHIMRLLNQTEMSNKTLRDQANRAILYLAQGEIASFLIFFCC
jgi:hypothetical protein